MKKIIIYTVILFCSFFTFIFSLCIALQVQNQKREIEELQKNYIYLTSQFEELQKSCDKNARIIAQDLIILNRGFENER